MSNVVVTKETTPSGGRYVARVDGIDGEALLVFERSGANLITADHTEAPPSLQGTGAAKALVARLFADARGEGFKVIPRCPYVGAQAKRNPEWADLLATQS